MPECWKLCEALLLLTNPEFGVDAESDNINDVSTGVGSAGRIGLCCVKLTASMLSFPPPMPNWARSSARSEENIDIFIGASRSNFRDVGGDSRFFRCALALTGFIGSGVRRYCNVFETSRHIDAKVPPAIRLRSELIVAGDDDGFFVFLMLEEAGGRDPTRSRRSPSAFSSSLSSSEDSSSSSLSRGVKPGANALSPSNDEALIIPKEVKR
mmetsp:Transcript_3403/g.5131  ORF Transcript_3403/g.5131 Transcript_3403/m.5131 type:complete len:211 (-) Transcript_3403:1030-1662(-)